MENNDSLLSQGLDQSTSPQTSVSKSKTGLNIAKSLAKYPLALFTSFVLLPALIGGSILVYSQMKKHHNESSYVDVSDENQEETSNSSQVSQENEAETSENEITVNQEESENLKTYSVYITSENKTFEFKYSSDYYANISYPDTSETLPTTINLTDVEPLSSPDSSEIETAAMVTIVNMDDEDTKNIYGTETLGQELTEEEKYIIAITANQCMFIQDGFEHITLGNREVIRVEKQEDCYQPVSGDENIAPLPVTMIAYAVRISDDYLAIIFNLEWGEFGNIEVSDQIMQTIVKTITVK